MKSCFLVRFVPDFLNVAKLSPEDRVIISENQNDYKKGLFYLFISNPNKKVSFVFNLKK